jgi:hypothetical protein
MVTSKPLIALIKTSLSFKKLFCVNVSTTAATQNCSPLHVTTFTLQTYTCHVSCQCRPTMELLVAISEILLAKVRNLCNTNKCNSLYFIRTIFHIAPTFSALLSRHLQEADTMQNLNKYYWAV